MAKISSLSQKRPAYLNPLQPQTPTNPTLPQHWGRLYGAAHGLVLASAAKAHSGLVLAITPDMGSAYQLEAELTFFLSDHKLPVLIFPDVETLPYDVFPPLPEIVSQRLSVLYQLPSLRQGVLIAPISTLMQYLPPRQYLEANSLLLAKGDRLDRQIMQTRLETGGYTRVNQVMAHGEFAVRGSLLDLFPMGSKEPYRIDLFDEEVESIRTFDPDSQRTLTLVERIQWLPAREVPLTEDGIRHFRHSFRACFGVPSRSCPIYRDVSNGIANGGVEYYLPLFFDKTATLFDYLPTNALVLCLTGMSTAITQFVEQIRNRYEQRLGDQERPILPPEQLFLTEAELEQAIKKQPHAKLQGPEVEGGHYNFASGQPPELLIQARMEEPAAALEHFVTTFSGRILFVAESPGRREALLDILREQGLHPKETTSWSSFLRLEQRYAITVAPLDRGLLLESPHLAVIVESQLLGERVQQQRRRKRVADPEQIIRNLTELQVSAPVVHEDHGIGRFNGLQRLTIGGLEAEFLTLEYADQAKLYVPVASLHLISRYTGVTPDHAPLHRLGSHQWQKVKRKAQEKIRDVAAELLEIYAQREAHPGRSFQLDREEYAAFTATFPFEETPDQQLAIEAVLADQQNQKPMDRVVCGDVGFGKTEVAMRAAFVAVQNNYQVAVMVPTTLLAQQHYQNFCDRFADWPIRIESLSRFGTKKKQVATMEALANGKADIVIGTHKLLQADIHFLQLGLVIIDEEHRFGVRQKEKLKTLRAEVDLLTLTATPIPRTLNMGMTGLRDLSIIATPPARRHPVKTFIGNWNKALIVEACQREIKRGGQVYYLHNEVKTIERAAQTLRQLLPEARISLAHGQMRESELEHTMLDFYHRRCHILVCSTIIESGLDVPNANTILIDRADKLGLAQLHQLRGRVGRSHHRAYAYLLTPTKESLKADAKKRLEAIESLEDLGAGFTLATHDLEIRGAGELLGHEQSGQIQEIGFGLYTELLERTVQALKSGVPTELEPNKEPNVEVDLRIPVLFPDDYLPDVSTRLVLYKRIAGALNLEGLRELEVETIDRFGLLPAPAKHLFRCAELKLQATPMGIRKIEGNAQGLRIIFKKEPNIHTTHLLKLIQFQPDRYQLKNQSILHFKMELSEPKDRVKETENLLQQLRKKPDAIPQSLPRRPKNHGKKAS